MGEEIREALVDFGCGLVNAQFGAAVGGGIGYLGNVFGPEVGLPTTIGGTVIGGAIGAFLATPFGQMLCQAAGNGLLNAMCDTCPDPFTCEPGTISCNGGPCLNLLIDPDNCGTCGNVVGAISLFPPTSLPILINGCGSGCFCLNPSGDGDNCIIEAFCICTGIPRRLQQ